MKRNGIVYFEVRKKSMPPAMCRKKIIAGILITSIVGSLIHIDEFSKIPLMIRHYEEHKSAKPDQSFISFLYDHYVSDQKPVSEKDKRRNAQLPFKSTQFCQS